MSTITLAVFSEECHSLPCSLVSIPVIPTHVITQTVCLVLFLITVLEFVVGGKLYYFKSFPLFLVEAAPQLYCHTLQHSEHIRAFRPLLLPKGHLAELLHTIIHGCHCVSYHFQKNLFKSVFRLGIPYYWPFRNKIFTHIQQDKQFQSWMLENHSDLVLLFLCSFII